MVCKIQCNLCVADYARHSTQQLDQQISEQKYSAISRHMEEHGLTKSALGQTICYFEEMLMQV